MCRPYTVPPNWATRKSPKLIVWLCRNQQLTTAAQQQLKLHTLDGKQFARTHLYTTAPASRQQFRTRRALAESSEWCNFGPAPREESRSQEAEKGEDNLHTQRTTEDNNKDTTRTQEEVCWMKGGAKWDMEIWVASYWLLPVACCYCVECVLREWGGG